jgi:hypothetical protein
MSTVASLFIDVDVMSLEIKACYRKKWNLTDVNKLPDLVLQIKRKRDSMSMKFAELKDLISKVEDTQARLDYVTEYNDACTHHLEVMREMRAKDVSDARLNMTLLSSRSGVSLKKRVYTDDEVLDYQAGLVVKSVIDLPKVIRTLQSGTVGVWEQIEDADVEVCKAIELYKDVLKASDDLALISNLMYSVQDLLVEQGGVIVSVREDVETAAVNVAKGTLEVEEAVVYRGRSSRKMICLIITVACILITVVVFGVVLGKRVIRT